jgi:hypothetical protein
MVEPDTGCNVWNSDGATSPGFAGRIRASKLR